MDWQSIFNSDRPFTKFIAPLIALVVTVASVISWFNTSMDADSRAYINSALIMVLTYYFTKSD